MFVIEVPSFNLNQIYNSYQAPRWIKLKDSKYVVLYRDKSLKIEQQKDRLVMSCNEEDFYNIWFNYFDLKADYIDINRSVKNQSKKFKAPANKGNGIHILNQDKFEMYVYCKLVQNVGWYKARFLMNRISEMYGIKHKQSMREAGTVTWYEFPTPEMLYNALSGRYPNIGNKVDKFLFNLSRAIVDKGFDIIVQNNPLFDLLGKHDLSVFPEEGVSDSIYKNFKCDINTFRDKYVKDFKNAGVAYIYILNFIMNPPKGVF